MINKAKERAHREGVSERVEFRVADVLDLPYDEHWFDTIILESVLTPLAGNKELAMSEMIRVLRPGGLIGANEGIIDPDSPPEFMAVLDEHPAIYGTFTPDQLQSLFEESGLEVVEVRSFQGLATPRARLSMGFLDLLKFMILVYPKLLLRLLRDPKIREAQKVDDQLTKLGKQYMGHVLIVGRKP
jgi:SAM-dependent methyltransferase